MDAHAATEQVVSVFTLLEDRVKLPSTTEVLGTKVTAERLDTTYDKHIFAFCLRGKSKQRIPTLDLPLPSPPPECADWIIALRRWARGR